MKEYKTHGKKPAGKVDENLVALEISEDRRLRELGIDPGANPLALWSRLNDDVREIRKKEAAQTGDRQKKKPV